MEAEALCPEQTSGDEEQNAKAAAAAADTAEDNNQEQTFSGSNAEVVNEKSPEIKEAVMPTEQTAPENKSSNSKLLWITNLAKNTRANDLKQLLSSCSKVVCAKIVVNTRRTNSSCFGYIRMASAEDALTAIALLNNTVFNGQTIKIDHFGMPGKQNESCSKLSKKLDGKVTSENEKRKMPPKDLDRPKASGSGKNSDSTKSRTSSYDRLKESKDGNCRRSESKDRRDLHRKQERALREANRRRYREEERLNEMQELIRRQGKEAKRMEEEREKLRVELGRIEREKIEIIRLERERQKLEREKLEKERIELQRYREQLEKSRPAVKRLITSTSFIRGDHYEDRKRFAVNDRPFAGKTPPPPRFDRELHCADDLTRIKTSAPNKDFERMRYEKQEKLVKGMDDYNGKPLLSYRRIGRFPENPRQREPVQHLPAMNMDNFRSGKDFGYNDRGAKTYYMHDDRANQCSPQNKSLRDDYYEHDREDRAAWTVSRGQFQNKLFAPNPNKYWCKTRYDTPATVERSIPPPKSLPRWGPHRPE